MFTVTSLFVFSGIGIFAGAWTVGFAAAWHGRLGVATVLWLEGVGGLMVSFYAIDPRAFMLGMQQLGI